ncbi:MAG: tetratricopeptide repeat protein [Thermodesulfobacteriota bacterium]
MQTIKYTLQQLVTAGWLVLFLCTMFSLGGCVTSKDISGALSGAGDAMKSAGNVVKHTVQGDYYLEKKDYSQGEDSFRREVKANPNSALSNYYYGRFLLAQKKNKKALSYLKKASRLKPKNPDFLFWQGLAYGTLNQRKQERKSYEMALRRDKEHLQSLIYLGHNRFKARQYKTALNYYKRALKIWPASPSSLYNRALIMSRLGRTPEEKRAWLEYLALYPSGGMARRAVIHLNGLKDYSYRNYQLAARKVTIEKIWFEPFSAKIDPSSHPSLELIGTIFKNLNKGTLQVVVYQKNNRKLAEKRAVSIKKFLLKKYPEIKKNKIRVSWFKQPEKLRQNRKTHVIDESVSFFITR